MSKAGSTSIRTIGNVAGERQAGGPVDLNRTTQAPNVSALSFILPVHTLGIMYVISTLRYHRGASSLQLPHSSQDPTALSEHAEGRIECRRNEKTHLSPQVNSCLKASVAGCLSSFPWAQSETNSNDKSLTASPVPLFTQSKVHKSHWSGAGFWAL